MDTGRTRAGFERSALIGRLWPAELRARSLEAFTQQRLINLSLAASAGLPGVGPAEVRQLLASRLRAPLLWSLGSSVRMEAIARQVAATSVRTPLLDDLLGVSAIADRRPADAVTFLARAHAANPGDARLAGLEDLARSLAASLDP